MLGVTETESVSVPVVCVDLFKTSHPSLEVQVVDKVLPPGLVSEMLLDAGLLPPATPENESNVGESAILGPVPPPLPETRFSVTVVLVVRMIPFGSTSVIVMTPVWMPAERPLVLTETVRRSVS